MEFSRIFKAIKSQVTIPAYYRYKGFSFPTDVEKSGGLFSCQIHGPDRHPSAMYNPNTGTMKCFSCNVYGDVIKIVQIIEGLKSPKEAAEYILRNFKLDMTLTFENEVKNLLSYEEQFRNDMMVSVEPVLWNYIDATGNIEILQDFDVLVKSLTDNVSETYEKINQFKEMLNAKRNGLPAQRA